MRPASAMPHRLHTAWVELADFHPCFTWQCPRSFCRAAPPNDRLHPRRDCVEITFDRKLPESVFHLRQQAAKRRRVEAMLAALLLNFVCIDNGRAQTIATNLIPIKFSYIVLI